MIMNELIVNIDVSEKKYFVSKYNEDTLAPELRDYIINELVGESLKKSVVLNITTKFKVDKEEEKKYTEILLREFKESINELVYESGSSDIKKLVLFFTGLILIFISYYAAGIVGEIFDQVLTIFGWVVLWEVAYAIFFTDAKRRRILKRYKQVLEAKIIFNKE